MQHFLFNDGGSIFRILENMFGLLPYTLKHGAFEIGRAWPTMKLVIFETIYKIVSNKFRQKINYHKCERLSRATWQKMAIFWDNKTKKQLSKNGIPVFSLSRRVCLVESCLASAPVL